MVHTSQPSTGQNVMCIVYHDVKLPVHHRRQLKFYLEQTFHYTRTFTDVTNLADCLSHTFIVNKLVIIVSGNEAEFLRGSIEYDKEFLHDPLVYELQFNKPLKSELSHDKKFQSIDRLIEKIDDDVKEYITTESQSNNVTGDNNDLDPQQETFPFGIHEFFGKQQSFCDLSREKLKFILYQSFIEVLLGIRIDEEEALQRMWTSFREDPAYQNDCTYMQKINELEQQYGSTDPIELYTRSSFFFRTVNKAFRCEDIEKIFDFQPFIAHMHQRLNNLRTEQRLNNLRTEQQSNTDSSQNVLRRGKTLRSSVLQQLEDNINKLISMNGFLSTTNSSNVANIFAGTGTNRSGYQSVLFEMHIDGTIDTKRPYADVSKVSAIPDEEEVLFFMGFIWRIEAVDKLPDNSWKVRLQLSTDMDSDLDKSFNELNDKCTFFTLGKVLHELGEYKNAINFYDRMLDLTSEDSEKKTCADIHFHIAMSAFEDKSYSEALSHLKKAEGLIEELIRAGDGEPAKPQPILSEGTPLSLMCILMNIGLVYQNKKDYKRAKDSFSKALEKNGSNNDKARVHYTLGVLHFYEKKYEKARSNYCQALELAEDQVLKRDINQRLETLNKISPPSNAKKNLHD